jgi:hypothetical protein
MAASILVLRGTSWFDAHADSNTDAERYTESCSYTKAASGSAASAYVGEVKKVKRD